MRRPSTAFAAILATPEIVMTLFAKSLVALALVASVSSPAANAFEVASLATSHADVQKAAYGYGGSCYSQTVVVGYDYAGNAIYNQVTYCN
jgi:hypothetical protein